MLKKFLKLSFIFNKSQHISHQQTQYKTCNALSSPINLFGKKPQYQSTLWCFPTWGVGRWGKRILKTPRKQSIMKKKKKNSVLAGWVEDPVILRK